jgi:DNA-binding transcriptional MerR regulator
MENSLPQIPAKRYFTIGEVGELCGVKPHVLRYWEQEFTQLRPVKRRGNRRYYQHHEVLMIRRIRELLYEQGFTISGARNQLQELRTEGRSLTAAASAGPSAPLMASEPALRANSPDGFPPSAASSDLLRMELLQIRALLAPEGDQLAL